MKKSNLNEFTEVLVIVACMLIILFVPVGIVILANNGESTLKVCDQEKRANFIIECARAANPLSDEEGEDLVTQCSYESEKLFCTLYKNENTDKKE